MILKLIIDTQSTSDIDDAIDMLQALVWTPPGGEDVPPVPLEQVIDEVRAAEAPAPKIAAETPKLVLTVVPATIAPPAAATEADAFAAMQAAAARGAPLNEISALLEKRKVKRVNQLTAEDRASFVVAVNQLALPADG